MDKLDKVIRAGEAKVALKKFRSWFDGPVQTPQDKLAKAVIKKCIEIIDKLEPLEAEPMQRWIPVTERLPEKSGSYIVCTVFDFCGKRSRSVHECGFDKNIGFYEEIEQVDDTFRKESRDDVTHWMPFPELPEGDAE